MNVTKSEVQSEKPITEDVLPGNSVDPVYKARTDLLNDAVQKIGMGKYQWHLFVVAGFGWLADVMWLAVPALILDPVTQEFKANPPYLLLGANIGLLIGAGFWSIGSEVRGRNISFNATLAIIGIFSMVAAASPNFSALIVFASLWSVGVGGNFPVDSAVFLEFLPPTHQFLLTVLSIWSSFGTLIPKLIAWAILPNLSCSADAGVCRRSDNMGWRYFLIVTGGLMVVLWIIRAFCFTLYESPKYLMSRGRLQEAVSVVQLIAKYNGRDTDLTLEQLEDAGSPHADMSHRSKDGESPHPEITDTSMIGALRRGFKTYDKRSVHMLFATRRLAISTSLIISLWGESRIIGLATPLYASFLPYYLATRGRAFKDGSVYITYRNATIIAVAALPAGPLAGWAVEIPRVGRKGTLAFTTALTGACLLASTTSRTSNALLGWNCGYGFSIRSMWAVLYTITPELFPTKVRGTGNGLAACAHRVFGVISPVITLYGDIGTSVPIFIAGALYLSACIVALVLPFESRGKASM